MSTIGPIQNQPAVAETTYCGSCLQSLYDIVNKVTEIFWAILQTICPCFFSSAALDANTVTPLNTGNANQAPQSPVQAVQEAQAQLAQQSVQNTPPALSQQPAGNERPATRLPSTPSGGQQSANGTSGGLTLNQRMATLGQPLPGLTSGDPVLPVLRAAPDAGGQPVPLRHEFLSVAPHSPSAQHAGDEQPSVEPAASGQPAAEPHVEGGAAPVQEEHPVEGHNGEVPVGAEPPLGMGGGGAADADGADVLDGGWVDGAADAASSLAPMWNPNGGSGDQTFADLAAQQQAAQAGYQRRFPALPASLFPSLAASMSSSAAASASASSLLPPSFQPLMPPSLAAAAPFNALAGSVSLQLPDLSADGSDPEQQGDGDGWVRGGTTPPATTSRRDTLLAPSEESLPHDDSMPALLPGARLNGDAVDPLEEALLTSAAAAASAAAASAADGDGSIFDISGLSAAAPPAAASGLAVMPPLSSAAALPDNPTNRFDSTDVDPSSPAFKRVEQLRTFLASVGKGQVDAAALPAKDAPQKASFDDDGKEVADSKVHRAQRKIFIRQRSGEEPVGFFAACAVATDWMQHFNKDIPESSESDETLTQAKTKFNEHRGGDLLEIAQNGGMQLEFLGIRTRHAWADALQAIAEIRQQPIIAVLTNERYSVSYSVRIAPERSEYVYHLFSPNADWDPVEDEIDPIYQSFTTLDALKEALPKTPRKYYAYELTGLAKYQHSVGTGSSDDFAAAATAAAALPASGVLVEAAPDADHQT